MASPEQYPEELDLQGVAGQRIVLPIGRGPATGYDWSLQLPAGVEQVDDEPGPEPTAGTKLGASTGARLAVTAPRGEHLIVARLARPWERDAPIRTVGLRLHVT